MKFRLVLSSLPQDILQSMLRVPMIHPSFELRLAKVVRPINGRRDNFVLVARIVFLFQRLQLYIISDTIRVKYWIIANG